MEHERALVERACRDPWAFGDLYAAHVDRIYSYIFHRVGNRADAEDLTSLTFQRALAALADFRWRDVPFRAWLYRIAGNLVADYWRRRREELPVEAVASLPAADLGPDEEAEDADLHRRLRQAVLALPPAQQEAVVLHFAQGLTYQQVGRVIGRSEGAAKQLVHRALATLRARLGGDPLGR